MELKSTREDGRRMIGVSTDDEISLVDVWLSLVRHKKWIVLFLMASLCIGVFYAYKASQVELYQYTTQIELASVTENNEKIDTVGNTLAKLEFSYIPYVLNDYAKKNPGHSYPAVKASIPKKSDLIMLKSKGSLASNALHIDAHESIIEKLLTDHKAVLNVRKKQLALILRQEKDKLVKLLKPLQGEEVLAIREAGFEQALGQAKNRTLISLDEEYKSLVKRRNEIAETNDLSRLSIAMMIGQDIDRIMEQMQEIGLQASKIDEIESQISGLKNSRPITPMISTRLPNKSAILIIVLSVVLGLMMGVFAALLAEFFTNVRMRKLELKSDSGEGESEYSSTNSLQIVTQKAADNR